MQLLVITLLLLIALSSIEARGSKLPTKAGYKTEVNRSWVEVQNKVSSYDDLVVEIQR